MNRYNNVIENQNNIEKKIKCNISNSFIILKNKQY